MELTIKIKDADLNKAMSNKIEWDITDSYSDEALEALSVTRASAIKILKEDAKFMAGVNKYLVEYLQGRVYDALYDAMSDVPSAGLKKLEGALLKVEEQNEKKAEAERKLRLDREEQERLKKTIETLTQMGYKITKEK